MKNFCVTGATGFLASHIVKQLLERGDVVVHGTTSNLAKAAHLQQLPGAAERLKMFQANLLDGAAAFKEAIKDCSVVIHTASPFYTAETRDELCEPAVKGTEAVIMAAHEAGKVERIVLTSSMAAVYVRPSSDEDITIDDSFWSDEDHMVKTSNWYCLSKTLAERRAWELSKEVGIPLTTVNPCLIVGPLLQPGLNTSHERVLDYLGGKKKSIPNATMSFIHVTDVAEVHVRAATAPISEVQGKRLLMVEASVAWKDMCDALRRLRPNAPVPTQVDEGVPASPSKVDSSPAQALLGRAFIPFDQMLVETVEALEVGEHCPKY
mmetsp:Transcript_45749/g.115145  ORF Transcript_45749/g.115145 Transcript_45749/m.115145 type:complete len:322 (-) Transcript_45749:240-1205(-)